MSPLVEWAELAGEIGEGWEEHPFEIGGKVVLIAIVKGTEIHCGIHPDFRHRVILRQRTREFLRPLFERHGFLTTRVRIGDDYLRFVQRMGFQHTWSNHEMHHFMLCSLPFGGAQCRQS